MKIELDKSFLEKKTNSKNIKFYNDLNKEEKTLFINFLKDVLNDKQLVGRNKSSAKEFANINPIKIIAIFQQIIYTIII